MNLQKTATYNFQNYGLPHEDNLNLIGLALSSRKVEHDIPISVNVNPEAFTKKLGPEMSKSYAESLEELWAIADDVGLEFKKVMATVHILERGYKIILSCYGD